MAAPKCRCGGAAKYGNLHCSVKCSEAAQALAVEHESALHTAGFVQHATAPNMWVKDGVAVTRERVAKLGLAKTVVEHATVVAQRGVGAGKP